jgi:hypothetical protein
MTPLSRGDLFSHTPRVARIVADCAVSHQESLAKAACMFWLNESGHALILERQGTTASIAFPLLVRAAREHWSPPPGEM